MWKYVFNVEKIQKKYYEKLVLYTGLAPIGTSAEADSDTGFPLTW